ncbi:MAG: phosphatase PAP2 family protein [Planctomycetota bacterium]|jgi:membrane-associated phospholipid phosphatase
MSDPNNGSSHARPLLVLVIGIVGYFVLLPADGFLHGIMPGNGRVNGDLGLVLRTLQQYGQGTVLVVSMLVIWLLDEKRRPRIADCLLASVFALAVLNLIKQAVGRPRPWAGDPWGFVGAFGTYTTKTGEEISPLIWQASHSDLWSTPSSHTAFAFLLSVFLSQLYPPLRPLVWPLAVLVGFCRVLFHDHYPSDVILGGAIGYAIAWIIVRGRLGVRLLETWRRPQPR